MSDLLPMLDSGLANILANLLSECKLEEALAIIHDNRYSANVKDNCADLVPVVTHHLTEEIYEASPDLVNCCVHILEYIAQKSNPEDALFEFLELIEPSETDLQFCVGIKLLQICLLRITNRRDRSLEWCFNSVYLYIKDLYVPENFQLEGKELILLDADPKILRIIKLYNEVKLFYFPFIKEYSSQSNSQGFTPKNILACFLLQLLGKPLGYLNLELEETKCAARNIAEDIVLHLSHVVGDIYMFLPYTEERCLCKKRYTTDGVYEDTVRDIFTNEEKTSVFSLAILYYMIISENLLMKTTIYNPTFIAHTCLFLSVELLKFGKQQNVLRKGLLLARDSLALISCIPSFFLNNPVHKEFCNIIAKVIIYNDRETERKMALNILNTYLFKLDFKGRYLVITNFVPELKHSGLVGYCITRYKDMLIECLSQNDNKPSYFFTGKRLVAVLNMFTQLPSGIETDLIDSADQIISALNLIRFLLIRDKNNVTGVWNYCADISDSFLNPLREALKLSKAHYEVKLIDLQNEQKKQENDKKVCLTVAGNSLPAMNNEQQLTVIMSALNAFDVMQSLLIRVKECCKSNPDNT